ncbi:MAG TPA: hypothetical protein DCZ69_18850, partial [Syntrophobacteraceae bacterium]|nr:hypothetical protein [Syntrophobacteraceae bacterium]
MRSRIAAVAALLTVALLIVAAPVLAAKQKESAAPNIDEKSMAILKKMGDVLGKAGKFTVTAHSTHDVVQESGLKIEFGR